MMCNHTPTVPVPAVIFPLQARSTKTHYMCKMHDGIHVMYCHLVGILFSAGTGNTKTVKCFRATFGANPSFAVDKFAFLDSVPATPQNRLPVKLTIDKSFRENLKSSKTAANSPAVSLPPPRPSTPSQDYMRFAEELQKTCMSTPGNKFDDSGWASNSNSVGSFSTLCGTDRANHRFLDVETSRHSSSSFDGVTFTEPLFTLLSGEGEPENELSTLSSEPDVFVSSLSTDDSVDSLHEWSMANLPSSWQQAFDDRLLSSAFDHLDDDDDDLISADINDVVSNASNVANAGSDYFPEVNELLAFVGQ